MKPELSRGRTEFVRAMATMPDNASSRCGFLVTGTDTGVGKTAVTLGLLELARTHGLDFGAMKPLESGCARDDEGELVPEDATRLWEATGRVDPLDLVCPWRFADPVAPGIAALQTSTTIHWERIAEAFRELQTRHRHGVLVEGAGGLLVPLDAGGRTVLDLAKLLDLPLVVVARNSLGTLNHTALTVATIESHGLECLGVILNGSAPPDTSTRTNREALTQFAGVEVIAEIPWSPDDPAEAIRMAAPALRPLLGMR